MRQNEGNTRMQTGETKKTKMNAIYPWPHSRPGSRLAGCPSLLHPPLSNRPSCRLPLARSLGSREYSGPGTALLLGAIILLPSHCPRGSLSPLLCHKKIPAGWMRPVPRSDLSRLPVLFFIRGRLIRPRAANDRMNDYDQLCHFVPYCLESCLSHNRNGSEGIYGDIQNEGGKITARRVRYEQHQSDRKGTGMSAKCQADRQTIRAFEIFEHMFAMRRRTLGYMHPIGWYLSINTP